MMIFVDELLNIRFLTEVNQARNSERELTISFKRKLSTSIVFHSVSIDR